LAAVPPLPKSFEDAARHHLAVQEELERVCESAHFRTSKRSCEFLQYIVRVTLDGRMDSLKERSIGIDLFGRDTSYEPSSDATVRVRANEVRKRLTSYYASATVPVEIRIDLPTGSYIPRFLPGALPSRVSSPAPLDLTPGTDRGTPRALNVAPALVVPPIRAITLMRPALLALLVCTLLLRHQLENRGDYLRFWDRLLSGRSAMVLAISPQDHLSLASSLYPLVWVAGRYGVDATMQSDSLTGFRQEALASVQVSYVSPPEIVSDGRLRWTITGTGTGSAAPDRGGVSSGSGTQGERLIHLNDKLNYKKAAPAAGSSFAVLTILPEDAATLRVQGTDAEAIRRLLEQLTVERNFPSDLVDRLDGHQPLQILLMREPSGDWHREISLGGA
jgi:hypothetical protein